MFAVVDDLHLQPCLVLAHSDPVYAAVASRSFRRLGWAVHPACAGPEARRLARVLGAQMVVLDTELSDESGWLTCAKLTQELPLIKAVLVHPNPTQREHDFAAFVGAAALYNRQDGVAPLLQLANDLLPTGV